MALAAPAVNDPEMGERESEGFQVDRILAYQIAYWPTQQPTGRKGKGSTQMTQTEHPEEEDDEMPLLPPSRRRLLDSNTGEDNDMTPIPSTSRTRGRGAQELSSQVASQASKMVGARAGRATQSRQVRESSATSDVSSLGGRPSRTTKATKTASKVSGPPTQSTRSGRVNTIVIEESEDEVNNGIGPARSSTGTATRGKSTRVAGTSEAGTTASGRIGDDEATTATGTRAKTQSTLGATGRRRLLVADDDDDGEMVS